MPLGNDMEWFSGTAIARVGPAMTWDAFTRYPQLIGIAILADDNGRCEAQSTLDLVLHFRVEEEPVPFQVTGFSEMGHSFDFELFDVTTQQPIASAVSAASLEGTLVPLHDYRMVIHARALFGSGDGSVQLAFGANANVIYEPEPATLVLVLAGGLVLARRTRRGAT